MKTVYITLVAFVMLNGACATASKNQTRTVASANGEVVLATVSRNLGNLDKIELISSGSDGNEKFSVVSTFKTGQIVKADVSKFKDYVHTSTSYLWEKDDVPVAVVTRGTVCYDTEDLSSTLQVLRVSRKAQQGGLEVVLDHYGCSSAKSTQPTNSGDFAVAEGLLNFIRDAARP